MNTKPGGGNKPQPYIPKGNGDKSGEYTNKSYSFINKDGIRNQKGGYNFKQSHVVRTVTSIFTFSNNQYIPTEFRPNSVIKKERDGKIVMERYYNNKGEVYLDIDYSNHGNPKTHRYVPHIHKWLKIKSTTFKRLTWEKFR